MPDQAVDEIVRIAVAGTVDDKLRGDIAARVRSLVAGALQHEHQVQVTAADSARLTAWLRHPTGGLYLGRACFEAVEGGGILVRTRPWAP
jgi:hypothetical protein